MLNDICRDMIIATQSETSEQPLSDRDHNEEK